MFRNSNFFILIQQKSFDFKEFLYFFFVPLAGTHLCFYLFFILLFWWIWTPAVFPDLEENRAVLREFWEWWQLLLAAACDWWSMSTADSRDKDLGGTRGGVTAVQVELIHLFHTPWTHPSLTPPPPPPAHPDPTGSQRRKNWTRIFKLF